MADLLDMLDVASIKDLLRGVVDSLIEDYLKLHLSISVSDGHPRDCVVISLLLNGEEISKDFIDYSEVVRVVERLNGGDFH